VNNPANVRTKEDLRKFLIRRLTKWTADLNRDRVRLHLPRRLGLMRFIPGMPFHFHAEIFLQISGTTKFQFPEEECRLGQGEICLVSRGLPHREKVRPWKGPFFNIVVAYSNESVRCHLARELNGGPQIVASIELETSHSPHLADLLKNVADWSQQPDAPHRFAIKGSLLANLAILIAALKEEPAVTHEPLKVTQVRQMIIQYLPDPRLSVSWIGQSLQSSPDYLSALFRKSMNKSIAAYITERRMNAARNLLVSSTLNISEISQASGYDDPSYFTRVFRKETGLTPRLYRDRALKQDPLNEVRIRTGV
jgi:AraC-like DNA-binding protein/mannose-6-phosphate isomerase-like protein (cupin superfamily)